MHIHIFAAKPIGGSLQGQASEAIDLAYVPVDRLPTPCYWEHRQYIADAIAQCSGLIWCNPTRAPDLFTTRQGVYDWRDRSGLSRPAAYHALMAMIGPQRLELLVGSIHNE